MNEDVVLQPLAVVRRAHDELGVEDSRYSRADQQRDVE